MTFQLRAQCESHTEALLVLYIDGDGSFHVGATQLGRWTRFK